MTQIDTKTFCDKLAAGECQMVVDVRTPGEYRAVHVQGAKLVPLDQLDLSALEAACAQRGDEPIYLLCKSGQRAKKAAEKIARQSPGLKTVVVEGGTEACVSHGAPVVRGKQTMSIERQVRIVAGALVAAGTALGVWINPWFFIVPGFVGCGLVFAGVTDSCMMGMALMRMPWNR